MYGKTPYGEGGYGADFSGEESPFLRDVADSSPATDLLTGTSTHDRTTADSASATDTVITPYAAAAADSAPATDTLVRALSLVHSISDNAPAVGTVTRVAAYARSISDTAAATDVGAGFVGVSVADSAPAADATSRTTTRSRSVAGAASATAAVSRTSLRPRVVSDSAPATDVVVTQRFVGLPFVYEDAPAAELIDFFGNSIAVSNVAFSRSVADSAALPDIAEAFTAPHLQPDHAPVWDVALANVQLGRFATDLSASGAVYVNSPQAYWKMAEPSGLSMIDDAHGRNGTWTATPIRGETPLNNGSDASVFLDGTESATVPYASWMNSATMSVEFWFTMTPPTNGGLLINNNQGMIWSRWSSLSTTQVFYVQTVSGGIQWIGRYTNGGTTGGFYNQFRFNPYTGTTGFFQLNDGRAHHIVITWQAGSAAASPTSASGWKMYIDGVINNYGNPFSNTTLRQPTTTDMIIGNWPLSNIPFVGGLDDVAFYSTVLNATAVANHWEQGRRDKTRDFAAPSGGIRVRGLTDVAHATDTAAIANIRTFSDSAPATDTVTASVTAPTYEVFDSFTRANNLSTLGVTEVGALTWTAPTSVWGVVNGQAESQSVTNFQGAAYVDMGSADVSLSVTWTNFEYYAGMAFRIQDQDHYLFIYFDGGDLYEYRAGSYISIFETSFGSNFMFHTAGDRYEIRVVGMDVQFFQNGVLSRTYKTRVHMTETKHGMYSEGPGDRLDNFVAYSDPTLAASNGMYQNRILLSGTEGQTETSPLGLTGEYFRMPGEAFYLGGVENGEIDIHNPSFPQPSFWYEWVCPTSLPSNLKMIFYGLFTDYPDHYAPMINVYSGDMGEETEVAIPLTSITIAPGGNIYDITSVGANPLTSDDGDTSYVNVPTVPSNSFAESTATGIFDGSALPSTAIVTQVTIRSVSRAPITGSEGQAGLRLYDGATFGVGNSSTMDLFSTDPNYGDHEVFILQTSEWLTMSAIRAGVKGQLHSFVNSFVKDLRITRLELVVRYRELPSWDALTGIATGRYNSFVDNIDYNEIPYVAFTPVPDTSYKIQIEGDEYFSEERIRFAWTTVPGNYHDDPTTAYDLGEAVNAVSPLLSTIGSTIPYGTIDSPEFLAGDVFFYETASGTVWAKWTCPVDWDTSKYVQFRILSYDSFNYGTEFSISVFTGTDYDNIVALVGAHALEQEQENFAPLSSGGFIPAVGETYLVWIASHTRPEAEFYIEVNDQGTPFHPNYDNFPSALYHDANGFPSDNMHLGFASLQSDEPVPDGTTRSLWGYTQKAFALPDGTIFRLVTSITGITITVYAFPFAVSPWPNVADLAPYQIAQGTDYVDFAMTAGTYYIFQFTDSLPTDDSTIFTWSVDLAPGLAPPSNDNHTGAIDLPRTAGADPARVGTMDGTFLAATLEAGYLNPNSITQDVWYRWVSPISGSVTFGNPAGNLVYMSAFLEDGTHISSSTSYVYWAEPWTWTAVAGTTYLIRIGAKTGTGPGANYTFSFTYPLPAIASTGVWKIWDYVNSVNVTPGCPLPDEPRLKVYDYTNEVMMRSKCPTDVAYNTYYYWGPWVQPDDVEIAVPMSRNGVYGDIEFFQSFGGGFGSLFLGDCFECSFHLGRKGFSRWQFWWSNGNGIQWNGGPGTCPNYDPNTNGGTGSTNTGDWSGFNWYHSNPATLIAGNVGLESLVPHYLPNTATAYNYRATPNPPLYPGATIQWDNGQYPTMVDMTINIAAPDYIDSGEELNYYLVPYRETVPDYGLWWVPADNSSGGGLNYQHGDAGSEAAAGIFIGSHTSTSDPTISWQVPSQYAHFKEDMPGSQRESRSYVQSNPFLNSVEVQIDHAGYQFTVIAITSKIRDDDAPVWTGSDRTWYATGLHVTATATVRPAKYRYALPPRPLKGYDYVNELWTEIACMIPDGETIEPAYTPVIAGYQTGNAYNSTAHSISVDPPAELAAGDRQFIYVAQESTADFNVPEGWRLYHPAWYYFSAKLLMKIADGTEGSVEVTWTPDQNGHYPNTAEILWLSVEGSHVINSVMSNAYNSQVTTYTTPRGLDISTSAITFISHGPIVDANQNSFEITSDSEVIVDPLLTRPSGGAGDAIAIGVARGYEVTGYNSDDYGYWTSFTVIY